MHVKDKIKYKEQPLNYVLNYLYLKEFIANLILFR